MTGGSDRLPLNCFHLRGANASQLRAISGGPSLGRASCSQGTDAVTTSASPSTAPSHAPRAKSGVCASPVDSASGTSRSFGWLNTFVFLPLVLHQRTHKHDLVVKVRQISVPQLNTYLEVRAGESSCLRAAIFSSPACMTGAFKIAGSGSLPY